MCNTRDNGNLRVEDLDTLNTSTCDVVDGWSIAFWFDDWCGGGDLATWFPMLLSHNPKLEVNV
jgi:hypothetical protein